MGKFEENHNRMKMISHFNYQKPDGTNYKYDNLYKISHYENGPSVTLAAIYHVGGTGGVTILKWRLPCIPP